MLNCFMNLGESTCCVQAGQTALMAVLSNAAIGHLEIAEFLLNSGANAELTNEVDLRHV